MLNKAPGPYPFPVCRGVYRALNLASYNIQKTCPLYTIGDSQLVNAKRSMALFCGICGAVVVSTKGGNKRHQKVTHYETKRAKKFPR